LLFAEATTPSNRDKLANSNSARTCKTSNHNEKVDKPSRPVVLDDWIIPSKMNASIKQTGEKVGEAIWDPSLLL
jgi:hypothetical protein